MEQSSFIITYDASGNLDLLTGESDTDQKECSEWAMQQQRAMRKPFWQVLELNSILTEKGGRRGTWGL